MLLPLRWLLYAITGPVEPKRGQFGGKKRKVPLRKGRGAAEWSEAVAPPFTPVILVGVSGVIAQSAIGFIRTSTGTHIIGLEETRVLLGTVTPRLGVRVYSVKALPRVGLAATRADIALFDYEIAALMLS